MLRAKEIFELDTEGSRVFIKEKEDKEALKIKYGKNANNFSGICF